MNHLPCGKCALLQRLGSMRQQVWEEPMDAVVRLQPLVPKQLFQAVLVLRKVKDWVML